MLSIAALVSTSYRDAQHSEASKDFQRRCSKPYPSLFFTAPSAACAAASLAMGTR